MMKKLLIFCALVLVSCAGHKENEIVLNSEEDLAGLRVAVATGSSYEMDLSSREDIQLLRFNTESDLLQALSNDRADVVVIDEVMFNPVIQRENGIKIALLGEKEFPTGFAFRGEDAALAQTMTAIQQRMEADGSMQQLKDFWLTDRFTEVETYTHIPPETTGKPLRVATCAPTAPLSFRIGDDWYGLEIDLLRELAKELHRPIEVTLYETASAMLSVRSGVADVLCGCIFITPERQREFAFSAPYHAYRPAYFLKDHQARRRQVGPIAAFVQSVKKNLITEQRWKYITSGLWMTLKISLLAIILGSVLGIGLYAMSGSRRKWMRGFAHAYNGFMAGIPDLVLLLILFYVVFAKSSLPADLVAVISFGLLFASSFFEVYASSLEAVPRGQTEAGLALGFTRLQTFFHIVFPQALRYGLPLYKGHCVALLKGTAIVGFIAVQDLTRAGDLIRARTFDAFIPLLVVTLLYFLLVWLIGKFITLLTPGKTVLK